MTTGAMPDLFYWLMSLRYHGSGLTEGNYVCYGLNYQVRIPFIFPGQTLTYETRPSQGVYAWIGLSASPGLEIVPNTLNLVCSNYGVVPSDQLVTERVKGSNHYGFTVITDRLPSIYTVTNLSPLNQRGELFAKIIVVPTINDMEIITDAMRRIYTSTYSETMLEQATDMLRLIAKVPPPIPEESE
jgi:hypothetical protein